MLFFGPASQHLVRWSVGWLWWNLMEFEHLWVEDSPYVARRCSMATFAFFTNLGIWEELHFERIQSGWSWYFWCFLDFSDKPSQFNCGKNHVSGPVSKSSKKIEFQEEDSGCLTINSPFSGNRCKLLRANWSHLYDSGRWPTLKASPTWNFPRLGKGTLPHNIGELRCLRWWLARWIKSGFVLTEVSSKQPAKSSRLNRHRRAGRPFG